MKTVILFILTIVITFYLAIRYEATLDPYEPGAHFDYYIECEHGYVYKILEQRRGTIQILNSDGTPLRCGSKIY